ncbi:MAG: efflux RND transporter periplasmic adaptor subunit [Xanthomonadales bacterium]|nr:efflux RND transporter periplasmic adaptor subunit [Xanthomonadales bacterium]
MFFTFPFHRIAVISILSLLAAGCGGGSENSGTVGPDDGSAVTGGPLVVRTVTAERGETAAWSVVGTVHARYESQRGFRLAGELAERIADAGDKVEEGEVLARLDATDLGRERDVALARVAEVEARARFARSELERLADMVATNAASEQEFDRAESQAEALEQALLAARAELEVARNRLGYATLRAPADGVVMEVMAAPGEVVATGEPVVRFARGDQEIEVAIPAGRRDGDLGTARLSSGQAVPLRDLAAGADPVTRTWRARYTLPEGLEYSLGETLRLTFHPEKTVVRIPVGALIDRGEGTAVWAVLDGKVERRPVEVVATGQETAEVRGLEPGTEVVAAGTHQLQAGQAVRVRAGR